MAIIKKQVPKEWRGPVYVSDQEYEIWAAVPMKLGSIRKTRGYWFTPDGMRFVSSQDASEYMLRLHRMQSPGPSSKLAEAVVRAANVAPRTETLSRKVSTAPAVAQRDIKLQQLLDMVRELQKESNDIQVQKKEEARKKLVP